MVKYVVIIENNPANFYASSPDIPGCSAIGKSIAHAIKGIRSAIKNHIGSLEKIPRSKGLDHYMNDESFKKNSGDYVLQVQL